MSSINFNNGKFSFEDALKYDQLVYQLATYDVSNGLIFVPKDLTELAVYQSDIAKKFNYFKHLIKTGEITYLELSQSIAMRHGPFRNEKSLTDDELIEDVTKPVGQNDNLLDLSSILNSLISGQNSNLKIVPLTQELSDKFNFSDLEGENKEYKNEDRNNANKISNNEKNNRKGRKKKNKGESDI